MSELYRACQGQILKDGQFMTAAEVMAELNTITKERDNLKKLSVKLYTNGYSRGHEDTVEGGYIDIHHTDEHTYFEEDVAEIIQESL